MKFMAALTLPVAAVATSPDKICESEYIVTRCLQSEMVKATSCNQVDFSCLCSAYQTIATCYNNCPNDIRAATARAQVTVYCHKLTTAITTTTVAVAPAPSSPSSSSSASTSASASSSSAGHETDIGAPMPTTGTGPVNVPASDSATHKIGAGVVVFVASIAGILAFL